MNNEIQALISNWQATLNGEPWYGRSVYEILEEADTTKAVIKPGQSGHSLMELLYHMLTWAEFTLARIEKSKSKNPEVADTNDWPVTNSKKYSWEKGLAAFKDTNQKITRLLQKKNDEFLNEKVDGRKYDFRFLLNGLIQHNIYHLGQIAYISKFLL